MVLLVLLPSVVVVVLSSKKTSGRGQNGSRSTSHVVPKLPIGHPQACQLRPKNGCVKNRVDTAPERASKVSQRVTALCRTVASPTRVVAGCIDPSSIVNSQCCPAGQHVLVLGAGLAQGVTEGREAGEDEVGHSREAVVIADDR